MKNIEFLLERIAEQNETIIEQNEKFLMLRSRSLPQNCKPLHTRYKADTAIACA